MKKKSVFYSLAVLLISAGILLAGQRRDGNGPREMMRMLELTEAQESQILDLKLDFEKQILPLKTKLDELQVQMKSELTAEKFSESKVSKLVDQMSDLQKEIHLKRILHQRAVRDLLTAEQKKKFDLHILSRGGKMGGHPGQGMHRKPPMRD